MKKRVITAVVLGLIMNSQLKAEEHSHMETLKGPALGSLAGALLAGPPGVVAGLIGGALIGHLELQKDQVKATSDQLEIARRQIEQLGLQQAQQQAEILNQRQVGVTRLNAISDGFSFCLRFRTESAEIEPAIQPHLDALVGMLKAFPEMDVEVLASADRRGSEEYNRQLTKRRAQAVVTRLIEQGVAAARIRSGFSGEELANYLETDLEGLDFDRYVVISLVLPQGVPVPGEAS